MTEAEKLLLTKADVATMLGISTSTVDRWTSLGQIPRPVRVGATTRWVKADLEAAVERLRANNLADAQSTGAAAP